MDTEWLTGKTVMNLLKPRIGSMRRVHYLLSLVRNTLQEQLATKMYVLSDILRTIFTFYVHFSLTCDDYPFYV